MYNVAERHMCVLIRVSLYVCPYMCAGGQRKKKDGPYCCLQLQESSDRGLPPYLCPSRTKVCVCIDQGRYKVRTALCNLALYY